VRWLQDNGLGPHAYKTAEIAEALDLDPWFLASPPVEGAEGNGMARAFAKTPSRGRSLTAGEAQPLKS